MDHFQSELFPERNRRVVILSQVLPANSTIGYDDLAYLTVKKVNGKEIRSLDDLAEAVKQPAEGFIKIETEEDPEADRARRVASRRRSPGASGKLRHLFTAKIAVSSGRLCKSF